MTQRISRALVVAAVSGLTLFAAGTRASAEALRANTKTESPPTGSGQGRLLTAARSAVERAIRDHSAATPRGTWTAEPQWRAMSAVNRRLATKQRSILRKTLIGASIGAAAGAGVGLYYAEATGDGAYPQAIPAFAGIGAGVGAITGLLVALF